MPEIINNTSKYTLDEAKQFFALTAKDNPKDLVEVEIGDSQDSSAFFPQVKIKRWDNECNVSYRLISDDASTPTITTEPNKIIWDKTKMAINFYDLTDGEGGYEFEVILKSKPKTNVIKFSLLDKDVDYFYQAPLTPEEIAEGSSQPENVVGSYAVYAKTPKTNYTGGKEYKTGKVGHIFRPRIEDANSDWVWGELNIENGILSVTIPQEFLDKAVYPVRHAAGLTFGWTTDGATAIPINANYLKGLIFAGAAGTGNSMTIRSAKQTSGTGKQKMALYKVSDNSLVAETGELTFTTTASTQSSNFAVEPTTEAVNYYLASLTDSAMNLYTDNTGATQYYVARTYTDGFPATVGFSSAEDRRYTIYATYTAGGASESISPSTSPSASPSISPSKSPSASSSISPSISKSISPSISPSGSVSQSLSPSKSPSASSSLSPSISPSASSSRSPSISPSVSPSLSSSISPSGSISQSISPSVSPSVSSSRSVSVSPSLSPSLSSSISPSGSISQSIALLNHRLLRLVFLLLYRHLFLLQVVLAYPLPFHPPHQFLQVQVSLRQSLQAGQFRKVSAPLFRPP
jgi:hypothetical protein